MSVPDARVRTGRILFPFRPCTILDASRSSCSLCAPTMRCQTLSIFPFFNGTRSGRLGGPGGWSQHPGRSNPGTDRRLFSAGDIPSLFCFLALSAACACRAARQVESVPTFFLWCHSSSFLFLCSLSCLCVSRCPPVRIWVPTQQLSFSVEPASVLCAQFEPGAYVLETLHLTHTGSLRPLPDVALYY